MENKVLAKVNGREITEKDMNVAMSRFSPQEQQQFYTEEGRSQLLKHLISIELVYNDALENGMDKDEQYLSEIEASKRELMSGIAITRLLEEVTVTDQETEDYYNANKDAFSDESVVASHILVDSFERAEEIKKEIEDGTISFADAAEEYSSCPSNINGGNLGMFSKGQMVKPFEDEAFRLEIGKVSEPVQTQFGFHIILVHERTEGQIKAFEEVKSMIMNSLMQERRNFKFASYTEVLKNKYEIEIL